MRGVAHVVHTLCSGSICERSLFRRARKSSGVSEREADSSELQAALEPTNPTRSLGTCARAQLVHGVEGIGRIQRVKVKSESLPRT